MEEKHIQQPNNKLFQVLLFEELSDRTFILSGESPIFNDGDMAMNAYAETSNPAPQIILASTLTELEIARMQMIKNMSDINYLENNVSPYL